MKYGKQAVWAAILAVPFAAEAQGLVTQRSISTDAAWEAATAALAQCRKGGHQVSVTVLDRFARTRVILNDDGANPHSFEHSLRKAYTALTYRTPSGEYGRRAVANPTGIGALHLDKITTRQAAFRSRGERSGRLDRRVGLTRHPGSPAGSGGDADAACAQAGIDHVAREAEIASLPGGTNQFCARCSSARPPVSSARSPRSMSARISPDSKASARRSGRRGAGALRAPRESNAFLR